jgi:hypothetical protein
VRLIINESHLTFLLQQVILVGGFAASDWLFEQMKIILTKRGVVVIRPENHV